MVTLFVSDLEQITILEYLLMNSGVTSTRQIGDGRYGISPPYIKVHGVPLDEQRAINWIKEQWANG